MKQVNSDLTLTYNPNLAMAKVNIPNIKVVGKTVQLGDRRTDGQTDGWTDSTKYIIWICVLENGYLSGIVVFGNAKQMKFDCNRQQLRDFWPQLAIIAKNPSHNPQQLPSVGNFRGNLANSHFW